MGSIDMKALNIKMLKDANYTDRDIQILSNIDDMTNEMLANFLKEYIHNNNIIKNKLSHSQDVIKEIVTETKEQKIINLICNKL